MIYLIIAGGIMASLFGIVGVTLYYARRDGEQAEEIRQQKGEIAIDQKREENDAQPPMEPDDFLKWVRNPNSK